MPQALDQLASTGDVANGLDAFGIPDVGDLFRL